MQIEYQWHYLWLQVAHLVAICVLKSPSVFVLSCFRSLTLMLCTVSTLSFVVGSDGYIYEGRGWHHVGRHTRGHNSVGYGVSVIGNYTASLPSQHTMQLLRYRLVQCAVDGGRLAANFTIHGHRQVVNYTTCPGDAFFSEIKTWEHFRD